LKTSLYKFDNKIKNSQLIAQNLLLLGNVYSKLNETSQSSKCFTTSIIWFFLNMLITRSHKIFDIVSEIHSIHSFIEEFKNDKNFQNNDDLVVYSDSLVQNCNLFMEKIENLKNNFSNCSFVLKVYLLIL
jgi:hypothetical protein